MILSGIEISQNIYKQLREYIKKLSKKPKLAVVLIWDNPSSIRYITQKQKWAQYIWVDFELIQFDINIWEKDLLKTINRLNNDDSINGYIVQLPLPKHIDESKIINNISPSKDVDGFTNINQWKIVIWDETWLAPCTPSWVMEIFKYYDISLIWANIVIIGRSNIVWKPLNNILINKSATTTICNSKTKNIEFYTKNADIIILAMWVPKFLKLDAIKVGSVVIDVWFSVIDWVIYGDRDFENIKNNWNPITPVPGWVGRLTVAMLYKNLLKAYNLQNKL